MDITHMDSSQIYASVLWGGVSGGYFIYGWKQKSAYPFLGSFVMTAACFLPALPMTLISIATMVAIWWLCKNY